jgi:hypothetical protein
MIKSMRGKDTPKQGAVNRRGFASRKTCSRPAVSGRTRCEHGDTAPWLQRGHM